MPPQRRRGRQDAKPFDATTKHLLESDPGAWLRYVGLPTGAPVAAVDADVSTIVAAADKVLRVQDSVPWLAQVELQASYDPALPVRLLHYNVSLHRRHGLPVASVIVLLRPEADGPAMSGALDLAWSGAPYLSFAYRIVRTWQQPVEAVLAGGLGTLPLAPIADAPPEALPYILRRIRERLRDEATPDESVTLWGGDLHPGRATILPGGGADDPEHEGGDA